MKALLAGVAAAGLVAAGASSAAAGTVARPYTVTVQRGHVKTTYRCERSPVRSTWRRANCIPVLRPHVTLDAHLTPDSFSGGTGIVESTGSYGLRVTQAAGILAIDDLYTLQGFRYITHSADGLVEIQLGNHGGAYQGDCLTWNASLTEFDAITCAWKVSQEINIIPDESSPSDGTALLQAWYNKGCMQADDHEGEGAAVQTQNCGYASTTVWFWDALVD